MSDENELLARVVEQLKVCELCGNQCTIDRTNGGISICGATIDAEVSSIALRKAIPPLLTGRAGSAGVVAFQHCGLCCAYCSGSDVPSEKTQETTAMGPEELAKAILGLAARRAGTIVLDAATSYLPTVVPALAQAKRQGLSAPVVYSSGGFERAAAFKLLEGLVDVYLPNIKYASSDAAAVYSAVSGYAETNRRAVLEMYRQVGDARFDADGRVVSGLVIRHTVLPAGRSETVEVLQWVTRNLPPETPVYLGCDYKPAHLVADGFFPELSGQISERERDLFLTAAGHLGLRNVHLLTTPIQPRAAELA